MTPQPIRFSHLRAFGRSAAHGHHALTAPESDQSYAMQRGTAVHAIVFGTRKVVGYPGAQRRGKEYDAFAVAHMDYEILTLAEYEKATRMADAVRQSKVAEPYLNGVVETTLIFNWMGMLCRSTPDVRGVMFVTELKTAPSADPNHFPWHALRMMYHAQMAMERIGARECTDFGRIVAIPKAECFIVCVEATEPHPVTVFHIDDRTLEIGEKMLTLWAERLKVSEASQQWPGYAQSVVPLSAPEDLQLDYGDDNG